MTRCSRRVRAALRPRRDLIQMPQNSAMLPRISLVTTLEDVALARLASTVIAPRHASTDAQFLAFCLPGPLPHTYLATSASALNAPVSSHA